MIQATGIVESVGALAPSPGVLAFGILMLLVGAACPTYYAAERLRGFGRVMADRLPYRPPPGMEEAEALEAAAESVAESAEEADTTEENA